MAEIWRDSIFGAGYEADVVPMLVQDEFNLRLIDVARYGYDLGLSDYPIWDEGRREWLNQRIIEHFWYREIGLETPNLFIYYLNVRMRENMPALNPLFAALDKATTDDVLGSGSTHQESTADGTQSTDGESKSIATRQPQSMLQADALEDARYWESGTWGTSTSSGTSGQTGSADVSTQSGLADASARWVEGYTNLLDMVFSFLEPCFCHLYYTHFNGLY